MELVLRNGVVVQIDDADERLVAFKWRVKRDGYVARSVWRNGKSVDVYLHREIAGDRPGCVVDHINGDARDNRRVNLRHVTASGNARNRRAVSVSGFKGVTRHKGTGRWQAVIVKQGRTCYLGLFDTPEAAARAYDAAALAAWGGEARLNFAEVLP